jgi:hypothetical protein
MRRSSTYIASGYQDSFTKRGHEHIHIVYSSTLPIRERRLDGLCPTLRSGTFYVDLTHLLSTDLFSFTSRMDPFHSACQMHCINALKISCYPSPGNFLSAPSSSAAASKTRRLSRGILHVSKSTPAWHPGTKTEWRRTACSSSVNVRR